ncbi:hypothetical protein K491DRAFT_367736 [Lophiostoma macrostomum CBS 122681]|uniref:Uncharacterized protein n=1 Tax=Lophiostoma macrostomum CBS 122681 TaxID=1314788 RepID=A0A6A6TCT5_9PLEO|nr:hypothetical protein K491DRAFT_367736 [Lophiostoma macrostomum CBS 122681]
MAAVAAGGRAVQRVSGRRVGGLREPPARSGERKRALDESRRCATPRTPLRMGSMGPPIQRPGRAPCDWRRWLALAGVRWQHRVARSVRCDGVAGSVAVVKWLCAPQRRPIGRCALFLHQQPTICPMEPSTSHRCPLLWLLGCCWTLLAAAGRLLVGLCRATVTDSALPGLWHTVTVASSTRGRKLLPTPRVLAAATAAAAALAAHREPQ